jgi:hypothetical protein
MKPTKPIFFGAMAIFKTLPHHQARLVRNLKLTWETNKSGSPVPSHASFKKLSEKMFDLVANTELRRRLNAQSITELYHSS